MPPVLNVADYCSAGRVEQWKRKDESANFHVGLEKEELSGEKRLGGKNSFGDEEKPIWSAARFPLSACQIKWDRAMQHQ